MPNNYPLIYTYFRLGLVTGLVDIPSLVRWADNQILASPKPDPDIIELSLSGNLRYSQIAWLLNQMMGSASPQVDALEMLFTRAYVVLEQNPDKAVEIIQGLRLLLAESWLPHNTREELMDMAQDLDLYERDMIDYAELAKRLRVYLQPRWELKPYYPEYGSDPSEGESLR